MNARYSSARKFVFATLFVTGACAAGCYRPNEASTAGQDALGPPVDLFARGSGMKDAAADVAPPVCDAAAGLSALRFSVRTSPAGGRFAPRNVGAIWIEDGTQAFVKTLEVWGNMRAKWLMAWLASSGGNTVDAITGATLDTHVTHQVTWDLDGLGGCEVPDGPYRVRVELVDRSGTGVTLEVPFVKQPPGLTESAPDTANFHDIKLTVE
jgi:hypothetical protein